VSRAPTLATRWVLAAPAFALSVLFNAGLFSFLGYAVFAILFVEMGEAWEGLGLMWFGSLIYISTLSVASVVALPVVRESSTTVDALVRYGATVLLVAASGTGFTWLAGPIFPWV
jgi:hypothetical protein